MNRGNTKQDILDALVEDVLSQYNRRSLFAVTDWDNPAFGKNLFAHRGDCARIRHHYVSWCGERRRRQ